MAQGFIDAVTSTGEIEGWAYDEVNPFEPLLVSIVDTGGVEVAAGVAKLYRKDLADVCYAFGWCYFRLRAATPVSQLRNEPIKLIAKLSKQVLHAPPSVKYLEAAYNSIKSVQELVQNDPTTIESLEQIESCEGIFEIFIKARGVEAFVRAAYVYVLGRSIDVEGLTLYNRLIRQKRLTPYAMLRTLADSAEFRVRPRSLVTPNSPGFPFRIDLR